MSNIPASKNAGFTLVELLVSLTIMGLIFGLLASGIRLISISWDRSTERISRLETVSRAAMLFQRDIAGLRRIIHEKDKRPEYVFTGQENTLSFVVTEPPYPTFPGVYFLEYSPKENLPEKGLHRSRALYERGMISFPGTTPSNQVLLLDKSFSYSFSYGAADIGRVSWSTSWTDKSKLPNLIKLEIHDLAKSRELTIPPIIARVQIDGENSCIDRKSSSCFARKRGEENNTSSAVEGVLEDIRKGL